PELFTDLLIKAPKPEFIGFWGLCLCMKKMKKESVSAKVKSPQNNQQKGFFLWLHYRKYPLISIVRSNYQMMEVHFPQIPARSCSRNST
ncbi:hypothetical protein A1A1_18322, partial [Planococcus antarcticus DSM 14505]